MNLIERVKNMLTTPRTEWLVVETETATPKSLLTGYVLPLAILASLGQHILGLAFISRYMGTSYFIRAAFIGLVSLIIGFYITAYIIDYLSSGFASEKNINKSAQLVAFSYTPIWIAGFLSFIPFLGFFIVIAGWVYFIYLFYLGLGILKKTPEYKKVIYMVVAFIVMLTVNFIVSTILMSIFAGSMGYGRFGGGHYGV